MFSTNPFIVNMVITHFVFFIIFGMIYYTLFNNASENYVLNSSIPKEEYLKNKLINSLYLSMNLQTTTGYVEFNLRSPLARLVGILQLFISLIITIGFIVVAFTK
jgi:hypothetical protein